MGGLSDKKILFVIGSGRSGTHLLGEILSGIPLSEYDGEQTVYFQKSTALATGKIGIDRIDDLLRLYNNWALRSNNSVLIEKSHPNIWLIEHLSTLPVNTLFVGIYRNIYDTVWSMLNHKGVMAWFNVQLYKQSRFLGIVNPDILNEYQSLAPESKCVLRILSHYARLMELNERKDTYVLKYEDLLLDPHRILSELSLFIHEPRESLLKNIDHINKENYKKGVKYLSKEKNKIICETIREYSPLFGLKEDDDYLQCGA